jgi:ubiquinone/menaquinone biosynthesis C-methylase UbiE
MVDPNRILVPILRTFFHLLYNPFAGLYDLVAATVSVGLWDEWVACASGYLTGPRILELGHGPGHLQKILAESNRVVFGLDRSVNMNRLTIRRLIRAGIEQRVVNGNAEALPFRKHSFDQVVATFPAEYIFAASTLAEVRRVLIPGGRLIVIPLAWITGASPFHRLAAGLFRITDQAPAWNDRFSNIFREAGFEVQTEEIVLKTSRLMVILAKNPADDFESTDRNVVQ